MSVTIMQTVVTFVVHGEAAPQGSKNPWGGESSKAVKPWRAKVAMAAGEAMRGPLCTGPVSLDVEFVFPRPKSHFGTGRNAAVLKASAPLYVTRKPDLDKLMRALGDAMTGVVFRDDSQIAMSRESKMYGPSAKCVIRVSSIQEGAQHGERAA